MKKEEKFKEKADELIQFCKEKITFLEKQIGVNSELEEDEIKDEILDSFLIENDSVTK